MRSPALPLLLAVPTAARGETPLTLPPGAAARDDARRLLDRMQAALAATNSATAMLERWCAEQHLAADPRISAIVEPGPPVPPTDEQRARLRVSRDEPVGYRRVRLNCGGHTLAEAENWYVPGRLTPAILAGFGGSTPFGTLIAPLRPVRRTVASARLWQPDAADDPDAPLVVPHAIFRHRALVLDASGRPLAEVAEAYTSALLAGLSVR